MGLAQAARKLAEHIERSNDAIGILFQNKHHESALILLFSWVDRLSWLAIKSEYSTGADFKSWLNKYLFIEGSKLECNANDLWASRCGLLHTGSAEARDVINGKARSIYYFSGVTGVATLDKQLFVNTSDLHLGLAEASFRFLIDLTNSSEALMVANSKLDKILTSATDI
jgi:hypothetical protein